MSEPVPTRHARQRFAERFPGEDFGACLGRAVVVPGLRLVKEGFRIGRPDYIRRHHEYRRDPVTQALFCIDPDRGVVITVYPREKVPVWGRKKRDWRYAECD